ncbi:MAG: O-antigen ligase family protein [Bacillota bacterium]
MEIASNKISLPRLILTILIWLTIFVPGHMYNWGVERIYIAFVAFLCSCCLVFNRRLKSWLNISPNLLIVSFITVTIIGLAGYVLSINVFLINTGIRDYIELLRWPICIAFILFVAQFFNKRYVDVFNKAIEASLLYCLFVFILYKINVPFLSSFFTEIIYYDAKTWFSLDGYGRLSVPFENPNFLAFYLNAIFTYLIFFMKAPKWKKYISLIMIIFLLYLTGSRSGWVGSFVIIFAWVLLNIRLLFTKAYFKAIVSLIIMVLILYFGFKLISPYITTNYRIQMLMNAIEGGGITTEANLSGRIDHIKQSWGYTSQAPLFGWGSAKYGLMQIIDNQYFTWLFRYGIIGTTIILITCFYIIINLLRLASFNLKYIYGLLALFAQIFVMLGTGAFLDNFRLFFIIVILFQVIWLILSDARVSIMKSQ